MIWRFCQSIHKHNVKISTLRTIYSSYPVYKIEKSDKLSQTQMPKPPKYPLRPFPKFVKDNKEKVNSENNNRMKGTIDTTKMCVQMWKTLDIQKKEEYSKTFVKSYTEYQQQLIEYEGSLTKEQLEVWKNRNNIKMANKIKKLTKKNDSKI